MSLIGILSQLINDYLIDGLFIVLRSHLRIFHSYGDVSFAGKGLQNFDLCSALRALEHRAGRDLFRTTPAVTRDFGFSGLIRMTAPFSRL